MPMLPSVVPKPAMIESIVADGADPAMLPVTSAATSSAAKASSRVRSTSTTMVAIPTTRASKSCRSMSSSWGDSRHLARPTCVKQAHTETKMRDARN